MSLSLRNSVAASFLHLSGDFGLTVEPSDPGKSAPRRLLHVRHVCLVISSYFYAYSSCGCVPLDVPIFFHPPVERDNILST